MRLNLIKCIYFGVFCGLSSFSIAQNVGINTTGATPSQNAILDLNTGNSSNLGLIIPNVTLGASLATFSPPILHPAGAGDIGMLVYNTGGAQSKGYYFWDGVGWETIATFPGSNWVLIGNSGTTPSTALITSPANNSFIGTTDAKDFVFATNDFERMRISSAGFIGIGTKNPASKVDDSGSFGVGTINISPLLNTTTAIGNGYSTIISVPSAVSTTYTLTLPSATVNPRRIYTVVYSGSGKGTIDITSLGGSIEENGAAVTPFPLSQGTVTFQSDGTNWDIVNITSGNTFGSFVGIKYVTVTTGATSFDAGTNSILVKVIGGGGAGGGGNTTGTTGCVNSATGDACGPGGGAGGYVEGFLNGLTGSSTFAVTIGAGGAGNANCTLGAGATGGNTVLTIANPAYTYTGNGGVGAKNEVVSNVNAYTAGGIGGTAASTAPVGTFLTVTGATGASSLISMSGTHEDASGTGAGSPFGPGGSSLSGRSVAEPGVAAVCYGAGGGGSIIAQVSGTESGGNGFQGVVIIYEYQ